MIETLESRTASMPQEDPLIPVLTITGIRFDDSNLAKPVYSSLIDYDHAPAGVQFEPCLQIREAIHTVKVRFEIAPAANVRFVSNDLEQVQVSSIFDPQDFSPPGLVSAMLVGGDPTKCDLVWKQSDADDQGLSRLNTLRLYCRFDDGRPLSALEEVEGGLYLAILNRKEDLYENPASKPPGVAIQATVKMLGFDSIGRPVYDLFHPQGDLPDQLVLEPAFRCREGQIVTFDLVLDLPDQIDLEFVTDAPPNQDQVAVTGFLPAGHPFQLYETLVGQFDGKDKRRSTLQWTQETGRQYCATSNPGQAKKCYCILGQASGFGLVAAPEGQLSPDPRKMANIDPTVIQPPNCTSSGICITP